MNMAEFLKNRSKVSSADLERYAAGPARTLGNLGRLAPVLIDSYNRPSWHVSLRLTEDGRCRRLSMFAWTKS
jgi:hypothetical protein